MLSTVRAECNASYKTYESLRLATNLLRIHRLAMGYSHRPRHPRHHRGHIPMLVLDRGDRASLDVAAGPKMKRIHRNIEGASLLRMIFVKSSERSTQRIAQVR